MTKKKKEHVIVVWDWDEGDFATAAFKGFTISEVKKIMRGEGLPSSDPNAYYFASLPIIKK